MSIKKYLSTAWQDISPPKKYLSSAWQECEFAKRYANSAWQEVWSNMVKAKLLTYSLTYGNFEAWNPNHASWPYSHFIYQKNEYDPSDGSISGSGYITVYVEGDFIDPYILFTWEAGFFRMNSSYTNQYMQSAGTIQVYTRTKSGTEKYTTVVSYAGPSGTVSGDNAWNWVSDIVYEEFTGEYDRIGFRINPKAYTSSYYSAQLLFDIYDMYVGDVANGSGTPVTFSDIEGVWLSQ